MDFIKQLNAFELWLETNYLPASSQLVWYKLFMLVNRCGWNEWITVDNRRLMVLADIKSETSFISARDRLYDAGLIDFKKGKKGAPNKYKVIQLYPDKNTPENEVNNICTPKNEVNNICTPKNGVQTELKRSKNDSQNGAETANINKLNKTKQNIKDNVAACAATDSSEPRRGRSKEFSIDSVEYKATQYLIDKILEHSPKARLPKNETEILKWCEHVDRMIRIDERPIDELRAVMKFATTNTFWRSNIMSTEKLRKQYDTLRLQMLSETTNANTSAPQKKGRFNNFEQPKWDFDKLQELEYEFLEKDLASSELTV